MNKVRIAQIGVGHDHAMDIINTLQGQTDIFEVIGYAVPLEEKGKYQDKIENNCQKLNCLSVEERVHRL